MTEVEWEYPSLADYQREWIADQHRFVAIEGATGTGKTHVYEPYLFQEAHSPVSIGDEYWWISPTVEQAKAVYDNVKRQLEAAEAVGSYHCTDTLREINTPDGGILCFKTGEKPDHLFGIRNVRLIIVDEFTRCRIALWPALLSIANKTGCKIRFIGNYRGEDSAWHMWIKNMESDPDFKFYKTTALAAVAAGIMPQSMFDTAKRTLPEVVFKALYLCEGSQDPSLLVSYGAVSDLWTNDHVPDGDPALTCDIALHGSDRFVMHRWKGLVLHEITVLEKKEPQEVTAIIQGKATEHSIPRSRIAYDADGLGAYLRGYLQGATPYQGGKVSLPIAGQKLSYQNIRSQCHFAAADAMNDRKIWIKTNAYKEQMEQEIFACLRTNGQNAALQWGIFPKDAAEVGAKARLGRSPDIFDPIPMRMFLELSAKPMFIDGLRETVRRKSVSFKPTVKHEGNTRFTGR